MTRKSERHLVVGMNMNPKHVMLKLVRCLGPGSPLGNRYVKLGLGPIEVVPKGHMAIYVGELEGEKQRVLVPVTHLNHPLLGKLLEKTEKVYGFDHPGLITIPCGISEFQRVQQNIYLAQRLQRRRQICCSIYNNTKFKSFT
ncbi:hypothetical protein PIB30_039517 [Stylosanthes scabra]|uniref:Small auxin up regulated protein n=1 Tax=Stylosanthes scabra TaxID=79078 RepID=A0ABU6QDT3_9FABA|nr:hypothetical protein [Stylosanthes scabra]